MRIKRQYALRQGKKLVLGERTLVMGILNVTPDSFSDGGKWNTHDKALRHMEEMVKDGADIIDIGAESSRPGFKTMPAQQEFIKIAMEAGVRDKFKIMIGGAPTSREWAEEIGADGWAFDAFEAVEVAKQLAARTA